MNETKNSVDFEFIYESFPDMCLSLETSTGKIVSCNKTVSETLGYTREEILGLSLFDLYHSSQIDKVKENLASIAKNERPKNSEFIVQKKNRETIEVTLKLNFVRDKNGKILYTNAVWRDVTELKRVQRELEIEKRKGDEQSTIIRQKNKEFTDAINYAKHIQDGILPAQNEIKNALPNSFIFYQPKSIVSGDFYWMSKKENQVLFSVADCTGHGVPGAFMSMVGSALLNEIVIEHDSSRPQEILNLLRAGVIKSLNKGREEYKISDGMDACLCSLNTDTNVLQFSGAHNSLLIVRTKNQSPLTDEHGVVSELTPRISSDTHNLYEVKGDKQPIGYFGGMGTLFTKTCIQLHEGDRIYLSSDGFQDQIGGPKGKKFLSKRFKEYILEISQNPLDKQKELLNETLKNWMLPNFEQTDDICIWGVEI